MCRNSLTIALLEKNPMELTRISPVKNENLMSEPMKVALGVFHGWPVALKYSWNVFIGHEQASSPEFITKTANE